MTGAIKKMIDEIVEKRSKGNAALVPFVRAKLIMKGINCDKYTMTSEDDPVTIKKLEEIAKELS